MVCKAQIFSYSQNHISRPTDVCIIGQVKNNIIVWYEGAKKYKKSVILVYDSKLKLIKKITTDILQSDIDPKAVFYNSTDSFYVGYQYKKGNKWKYKLAGFDANGNLSSTYIIDSSGNLNSDDNLSYSFCQSGDKKILGCVKTITNRKYNALKFEVTFLNYGILYREQFSLGFDKSREKLVDLLIDSNKNITFLKTSNTDSGFCISVIKKEFSVDQFLIATKKIAAGNLRNGTSHFFNKFDNYTVYGVWENSVRDDSLKRNQKYKTGLYTWKIDEKLGDMPGDTILYDDSTIISQFTYYANSFSTNKSDNFFGIQTDSVNIPISPTSPSKEFVFQNLDGKMGSYTWIEAPKQPSDQILSHYKVGFTVIGLNNHNQIVWRNELKNNPDSILLTDFANNKIVAGKKGIHLVRPIIINKKMNTIEHILITYSGKYERVNTIAWNNSYIYFVSNAAETNDGALIIPCFKDNYLIFAKMILE